MRSAIAEKFVVTVIPEMASISLPRAVEMVSIFVKIQ